MGCKGEKESVEFYMIQKVPGVMLASVGSEGVINSNVSHFCWPGRFAHSHINRINPDKNTFLNSNLLLSNILNHLPTRRPDPSADHAYTAKDQELERSQQLQAQKREKMERVRNQAKARTQSSQEARKAEERELAKQVERVQMMRTELGQKARDVMSRKEDTAYLGRNLFLQGEKFLKGMREANAAEKALKTEATRLLMKDSAKQKGRTPIRQDPSLSQDHSVSVPTPANSSLANASLEASVDTHHAQTRAVESAREQGLAQMIRQRSAEVVFGEQRRRAAWEGFAENWAMGFHKNEDVITTKKKRRNRRSPRKFVNANETSTSNLLDYNDLSSRHASLKKYREHFTATAASYTLLSP